MVPVSAIDNSETTQSRKELLQSIQKELEHLKNQEKQYASTIASLREKRTGIHIEDIKFSSGGKAVVGLANIDEEPSHISLNIRNVTVESRGKGVVGIVKNFDVLRFLDN